MKLRLFLLGCMFVSVSQPARAAEHLMHVGEVLLSKNGNTQIQYIELSDKNSEPFASTTYIVEIFDAAGASKGEIAINKTTLVAQQAAFFIATTQAATEFGKTADATLTITLDSNGTACFGKKGVAATTYIHCLKWGTATSPAGASSVGTGSAPSDGMSLSLQPNGSFAVVEPSPKAANNASASSTDMTGAPSSTDMAGAPAPDLTTVPTTNSGSCSVGGGLASSGTFLLLVAAALLLARRRA